MKTKTTMLLAGTFAGALLTFAMPALAQSRHTITEICTGDCAWEKVAECSGFIEGINVSRDGTIYLVGYLAGEILRVDGASCTAIGTASGAPNGMKIAADGTLIVADRDGGLQRVDPAHGNREVIADRIGTAGFRGLNDLVIDSAGGIYFSEPYGSDALNPVGKVYYLAPHDGATPEVFAEGFAFPNGLGLSADGLRLYVAEYGRNQIVSVPSARETNIHETAFVFARFEGGIGPDGLTVDADGNVYVAHFGAGEVAVVDAQGFHYGTMPLPEGAMHFTTNVALHDGYLYLTESLQDTIWRMPVSTQPLHWH